MKKPRTEPYDVPNVGLTPMIYIEAWAAWEAFMRLGFTNEELDLMVCPNLDTGERREDVIHVRLRSAGSEFIYTVAPIDRPLEEAQKIMRGLFKAMTDRLLTVDQKTDMYRVTTIGALDGKHFLAMTSALINKGFRIRAIED